MSLLATFDSDSDLELKGFTYQLTETTRVTVARAGGANVKFQQAAFEKLKPYQAAINNGTMKIETMNDLLIDVFALHCVRKWETLVDGEYRSGIENWIGPDATVDAHGLLAATSDNVAKTLRRFPDAYAPLKSESERLSNYRRENVEAAAKN